jgi:hypothetical protein
LASRAQLATPETLPTGGGEVKSSGQVYCCGGLGRRRTLGGSGRSTRDLGRSASQSGAAQPPGELRSCVGRACAFGTGGCPGHHVDRGASRFAGDSSSIRDFSTDSPHAATRAGFAIVVAEPHVWHRWQHTGRQPWSTVDARGRIAAGRTRSRGATPPSPHRTPDAAMPGCAPPSRQPARSPGPHPSRTQENVCRECHGARERSRTRFSPVQPCRVRPRRRDPARRNASHPLIGRPHT